VAAPAPEGFGPGSPFGRGLCALVIHLHVTQAISFERLARLLAEVFGLTLSEGAITNILARAEAPLLAAVAPIAAAVRESPVVGSDETSARVGGARQMCLAHLLRDAQYAVEEGCGGFAPRLRKALTGR
jgi:transposase